MAEQNRKPSRASQPSRRQIIRHPLFPAVMALWIGALFGLGSLLIPTVPLGMTTRILLALAMAGIGGVAGALITRRIAGLQRVKDKGDAEAVGEPVHHRRRSLLVDDEGHGVANVAAYVPFPGDEPQFSGTEPVAPYAHTPDVHTPDVHAEELAGDAEHVVPATAESAAEEDTLPVGELFEEPAEETQGELPDPADTARPGVQLAEPPAAQPFPRLYVTEEKREADASSPVPESPAVAAALEPPAAQHDSFELSAEPSPDMPAPVAPTPIADAPVVDAPAFDAPVSGVSDSDAPVSDAAAGHDAVPEAHCAPAELDDLSYPELLDRLATGLQRRRGRLVTGPHPAAELPPADFVAGPLNFAPLDFDSEAGEAEEGEEPLPEFIPPRQIITPSFAALADCKDLEDEEDHDAPDSEEGEESEGGYSSLLDFSRPAPMKQAAIRIEDSELEESIDESVAIFPDQETRSNLAADAFAQPQTKSQSQADASGVSSSAADSPEETERALREALAALQRMSGAA